MTSEVQQGDLLGYYMADLRASGITTLSAAAAREATREELILSVGPLVVSLAQSLRGNSDRNLEDMVQAGNIGVLLAADSWDPDGGVAWTSWAYRQAYREIGREYQRPMSCGSVSLDEQRPEDQNAVPDPSTEDECGPDQWGSDPSMMAEYADTIADLHSKISELPPARAGVMRLLIGGMTQSEAATTLGITEASVSEHRKRSLSILFNSGINII